MRIGVAPQLNWLSGGYTSVSFKVVGSSVEAGMGVGSVEGAKHFDVVRAPFACELVEVNGAARADPRLINRDPYGEGWFAVLKQSGGPSKLKAIADAASSIQARLEETGVRCFAAFPDRELFEIGVECSAVLVRLNESMTGSPSGTVFHLVSDDPTSELEMLRWQMQTGNSLLETVREGGLRHFIVRKKRATSLSDT